MVNTVSTFNINVSANVIFAPRWISAFLEIIHVYSKFHYGDLTENLNCVYKIRKINEHENFVNAYVRFMCVGN